MLFYSASTSGFYDDEFNASIPDDAVPISTECHRQLLDAQTEGLVIVAGEDGHPIAVERPAPTLEQALNDLRARRGLLLAASDYTQMPDAPLTEASRDAWRIYRQALRDLPETVNDLAAIQWPLPPSN